MSQEIKLLPCPFCGSTPWFGKEQPQMDALIRCENDDCPSHPECTLVSNKLTVAGWNTRAPQPAPEAVAWRWRSIFNKDSWVLGTSEPFFDNDQYIKEPLYASIPAAATAAGEPKPVAFTNAAQLAFLKDPKYSDIPMAMWATLNGSSQIPLFLAPPAITGVREDWQPIETAPKDGTKVDLFYPYPRGRTIDCMWRQGGVDGDGRWIWLQPQWGSQPGLGIDWHLLPESEWEVCSYPNMEPTHWMPVLTTPGTAEVKERPMLPWELQCLQEVCAAPECDCPAAEVKERKQEGSST